jgi:hypothetical protein
LHYCRHFDRAQQCGGCGGPNGRRTSPFYEEAAGHEHRASTGQYEHGHYQFIVFHEISLDQQLARQMATDPERAARIKELVADLERKLREIDE